MIDHPLADGAVVVGRRGPDGITPFIGAAADIGCATAAGADMVDAVQDLMADFFIGAPSPPSDRAA